MSITCTKELEIAILDCSVPHNNCGIISSETHDSNTHELVYVDGLVSTYPPNYTCAGRAEWTVPYTLGGIKRTGWGIFSVSMGPCLNSIYRVLYHASGGAIGGLYRNGVMEANLGAIGFGTFAKNYPLDPCTTDSWTFDFEINIGYKDFYLGVWTYAGGCPG